MADINTIFKITASVIGANAVKGLGEEIKKVSTGGENLARSFSQGALALKAFAASQAVGAIKDLVMASINLGDELNDISQRTGVAVSELGKYKVAADNSGTSIESVAASFNKLNKNLVDARNGTGPAAAAFRAMGISITDANGQLKNADQVTAEIADRFQSFPDGPQKAALAMAVFGKSGAEMIPMLNMGSEAIKEFGLNIDQEFATAADNFNDKVGIMRAQITQFGIDTAKELLPALSDAVDAFSDLFDQTGAAEVFGQIMGDVIRAIVVGLGFLIKAVKDTIAIIMALGAAARGVMEMAKGDFDLGKQTIMDAGDWAAEKLKENEAKFDELVKKQVERSNAFKALGGKPSAPLEITVNRKPSLPAGVSNAMSGFDGGKAADKAAGAMDKATAAAEKWLAKQRESIETLKQEADYIGKTSIEITKLKDARAIETDVAEKTVGMSAAAAEKFREEAEAIKQTRQEILQYNYEQSRTFGAGAQEFFTKYAEKATDSATQIKDALEGAFKGAEDALVDFVTTGKLDFRSLADSIIKDLARIVIQQTIMAPIANALGGLFKGGGGGFSIGKIFGFASGGDHMGGLRIVGENGPELEATGRSRIFNARQTKEILAGGGGGQTNNVSVSVNVQTGQTDVKSDSQTMAALGKKMAEIAKATLINEKRPGGLLAQGA